MTSLHLNQHHHVHVDSSNLRSFDQLKRHSVTQNELSDWCRANNPPLVTLTKPSLEEVRIERDHETLPPVALGPQADASNVFQSIRTPGIYLDDSDADADDERPPSPTTSFTDEFSENDTGDRGCLAVKSTAGCQATDPAEVIAPSLTRSTRIRFRSRVRITSGLHRHRHSATGSSAIGPRSRENTIHLTNDDGGSVAITPSSSLSGSPSSSISAPLRSRTDDEAGRPGWGPLGQRVSMFARKNRRNKPVNGQIWAEGLPAPPRQIGGTETTPLLVPAYRVKSRLSQPHRRKGRRQYDDDYSSSPQRTLCPEEVDEIFGKWPDRLLNYRWWWWLAEAVVCCRCLDETDDEFN